MGLHISRIAGLTGPLLAILPRALRDVGRGPGSGRTGGGVHRVNANCAAYPHSMRPPP